MKPSRCISAFLIAPWAAPIVVLGLITLAGPRNLNDVLLIGGVVLLASYSGAVVFGFPVVQILNKRHSLNLKSLALSGIVVGTLVFVIAAMLVAGVEETIANIEVLSIVLGSVMGVAVAIAFGLIAGVRVHGVREDEST